MSDGENRLAMMQRINELEAKIELQDRELRELKEILDTDKRKSTQVELMEEQLRLESVMKNTIECAPLVLYTIDINGIFLLSVGAALKEIGLKPGQVVGLSIFELYKDFPDVIENIIRALKGEKVNYTTNIGDTIWEVHQSALYGPNNEINGVVGVSIDITKRMRAEKALSNEKERLRITLESIGDAVIATDKNGDVLVINNVAQKLIGMTMEEAIGKSLLDVFDIYNEITGEKCLNPVQKVFETGKIIELANHTALRSKDGMVYSIADSAAPIIDVKNEIVGVVLVFRDVTEQKRKEDEILFLSYHDNLTKLKNRAYFEAKAKMIDKEGTVPVALIIGDVNGLKLINDVFGHNEGDRLLINIAHILKKCCEPYDMVARYGGDEFCILLPNADDKIAQEICKNINLSCIDYNNNLSKDKAPLSISLGYSVKVDTEKSIFDVIKLAEDSMYKNKLLESKSHHNSVITYIKATLFEKSQETEMHANRLITYTRAIGKCLKLSDDVLNDLSILSMLHDIGKIGIDENILTKPGKLTESEWEEIKRHPEIGFRIVRASADISHVCEFILAHHERWDGKGYPQGLKGDCIPLLSRILSIVDAYDVMTNGRAYKKAMPKHAAIQELISNAGTQFDPDIVDIFVGILERE